MTVASLWTIGPRAVVAPPAGEAFAHAADHRTRPVTVARAVLPRAAWLKKKRTKYEQLCGIGH